METEAALECEDEMVCHCGEDDYGNSTLERSLYCVTARNSRAIHYAPPYLCERHTPRNFCIGA